MTYDLVETARRAEGSDLLPKVSFGVMNAEVLILKMADRIEALKAEVARLIDALNKLNNLTAKDAAIVSAALQDKGKT